MLRLKVCPLDMINYNLKCIHTLFVNYLASAEMVNYIGIVIKLTICFLDTFKLLTFSLFEQHSIAIYKSKLGYFA